MKTEMELLNDCKYIAVMNVEAIAASTAFVLVDLSDTTNYPHNLTSKIILHAIHLHVEAHSNGVFDLWIGVVKEADATNGSVDWIEVAHLEGLTSLLGWHDDMSYGPANLEIVDGELTHVITGASQDDNTNWQTDTGLQSPAGAAAGATGKPGAGDLVMWVEKVSGSGNLDVSVAVQYETL